MEQRTFKLWSRIMSAMLAAVMIFACMGTAVFGVSGPIPMTAVAAGSATPVSAGDIVVIGTADELFAFAKYVNGGNDGSGITFKLTADIVLNDMSDFAVWSEGYAPAKSWTPIGGEDNDFSGTFDGDGHTVSGIYINSSSDFQGLFGYIRGATVKNVGVTQSYIKGARYVGGVAGSADGCCTITNCYNAGTVAGSGNSVGGVVGKAVASQITDCYNTGSVTGSENVGGVVGYALGDSETTCYITNCYNTGSVTGTSNVGGVVGYLAIDSETANCYNTGSVTGTMNSVGGIAGSIDCSKTTNCYNTGSVTGTSNVGGVVGNCTGNTSLTNCYNTGSVTGTSNVGGVVGFVGADSTTHFCYYLEGSAAKAVGNAGAATTDTFNDSGVLTTNDNNGMNQVIITSGSTTLLTALNAWVTNANPAAVTPYLSWTGTVYPVFPTVSVPIWNGSAATGFAKGTGDRGYPYVIETAEQLKYFADQVNAGTTYTGQYIKLAADLVLNAGAENYASWGTAAPAKSWTPIGDFYIPFSGTFDGDGHTISGIYINSSSDNQGLFGHVENGTVKNVGVTQSYIKGKENVGAVAGSVASSSKIINCYNAGSVYGTNYNVGGVVGFASYSASLNCYNAGSVYGTSYNVGGVVGRGELSPITNSYNTGLVSGSGNNVGGIAGSISDTNIFTNCYNAGKVKGTGSAVGGIVGSVESSSTITNCYHLKVDDKDLVAIGSGTATTDTFDSSGVLTSANNTDTGIIANITTLSYVLNVWVNRQTLTALYSNWTEADRPAFSSVSVPIWNGSAVTAFASGTGTEADPHIIKTAEQLKYFANQVNAGTTYTGQFIKLAADLVLNADAENYASWGDTAPTNAWDPIGKSFYPFDGTFDGDGHTISGIYINSSSDNQGLFGYVNGGTVKNVGVTQSYIKGADHVGGVVGCVKGQSTITNCYNTGSVMGVRGVGGVVGYRDLTGTAATDTSKCYITGCYNTGAIDAIPASDGVTLGGGFGGILGVSQVGIEITDCYNIGTVKGNGDVGGVAGLVCYRSAITDCYNTGSVNGLEDIGNAGGIIGYVLGSTVTDCYNVSEIVGKGNIGGVAAQVVTGSTVTDCYNTGSVTANVTVVEAVTISRYFGGVVGYVYHSTVTDCYNTGAVTANGTTVGEAATISRYVGGVAGYVANDSGIVNCYNTGAVTGTIEITGAIEVTTGNYVKIFDDFGGVAGYVNNSNAVINCYNTGAVADTVADTVEDMVADATTTKYVGGVAGAVCPSKEVTNCYYLEGSATKAVGSGTAKIDTFNASGVLTSANNTGITANTTKLLTALNAWVTDNQTTPASYSSWTETFFPVLSDVWHATIGFAGGVGTESAPYTIETVEQLKYFAYQVNAGITSYTGEYIKLAADLVLNVGAENYASWGTAPPANAWTPIGNSHNILFKGTFDGDGHTISGIYINSASDYQGLFGYVESGTVKNVGVTQSYIKGAGFVGGVVGRIFGSGCAVTNCYNTGSVSGSDNNVGGVVGDVNACKTTNCYNTGSVSGSGNNVGGVVGHDYYGPVFNCYNAGSVSGSGSNIGGVVGNYQYSNVSNCYNTGSVTGTETSNNVGGIVGLGTDQTDSVRIMNCYNTGTVTGNEDVGGIAGDFGSNNLTNCYYLAGSATKAVGSEKGTTDTFNDSGVLTSANNNGKTGVSITAGSTTMTEALLTYAKNFNLSNSKSGYRYPFSKAWAVMSPGEAKPVLVSQTPYPTYTITYKIGCIIDEIVFSGTHADGYPLTHTYNTETTLQGVTAPPFGYTDFGGWFTNKACTGTALTTLGATEYEADITLYAKLTAIPAEAATITAQPTGGTTPYGTGKALSITATEPSAHGLYYQWYSNTTNSNTGGTAISGATSSAFTTPTAENLGTKYYYCVVTSIRFDNFLGTTTTSNIVSVEVIKADPSFTVPTAKTDLVYDGSDQELIIPGSTTDGEILYSFAAAGGEFSTDIPKASDAGGYSVFYKVIGDTNHNNSLVEIIDVEIAKATPVVTPPTANTLTYTGSSQALISAGSTTGGTLLYSINGSLYSPNIPTAKEVGDYTVYYQVLGNPNYASVASQSIEVTIGKADYDMSGITFVNGTAEYDGNAHSVVIGGTLPTGADNIQVTVSYSGSATNVADGAVTVTATFATTSANYNTPAPKTATITVTEGVATLNPAPGALNTAYNGRAQALVTAGTATNGTVMYKLAGGEYSAAIPEATDAGTYTVYYKVVGNANYNDVAEASVTVTISPAVSTLDTAPTANNLAYDGSAQALVTAGAATNGTVMYKLTGGEYSATIPTATDAGTYTVYYKVVGNTNYNDVAEASVTVTITVLYSTLDTAPAANTLIYTGSAQALVTAGTATNGTVMYKLAGGTYSTDIPTATDAGTYTVYYKVAGNANYNDTDEASVEVRIAKAASTVAAPTANTLTYNGSAQALVTAGTATNGTLMYKVGEGDYSTSIPTATDAGDYTVYYKAVGGANYNDYVGTGVTVTIGKADYDMSGISFTNATVAYDGSAHSIEIGGTLPTGADGIDLTVDYTGSASNVSDGEVTVTATFSTTSNNYNVPAEMTATIRVTESASAVITAPTANTLTYNKTAQALVTAGTAIHGTVMYKLGDGTYSVAVPTATNAGTHTVYYKVIGDENHSDVAEESITVTIAKADYDMSGITFENATVEYDGNPHSISIDGTLPEGVSVTYIANTLKEAGSISVTATFEGDTENYNEIPDMTATLTVVEQDAPQDEGDGDVAKPVIIASASAVTLGGLAWLVIVLLKKRK